VFAGFFPASIIHFQVKKFPAPKKGSDFQRASMLPQTGQKMAVIPDLSLKTRYGTKLAN
jgi:hypothetical protein